MALAGNAVDAAEFVHLTYGELVKQFGLNTTHTFAPWGSLSEAERTKWTAALSVIHAQVLPHGPSGRP